MQKGRSPSYRDEDREFKKLRDRRRTGELFEGEKALNSLTKFLNKSKITPKRFTIEAVPDFDGTLYQTRTPQGMPYERRDPSIKIRFYEQDRSGISFLMVFQNSLFDQKPFFLLNWGLLTPHIKKQLITRWNEWKELRIEGKD